MHTRYNKSLLERLGYSVNFHEHKLKNVPVTLDDANNMFRLSCGQYEDIIRIIFDTNVDTLPNLIRLQTSDSMPIEVRNFIQGLLAQVPSIQSAPDSQTAFEMIFPKEMQTYSNVGSYRSHLESLIGSYQSSSNNQNTTA